MGSRLWILLPLILGLHLGCEKETTPKASTPDTFYIVATAYPLADIARQVTGPLAKCDWVVEQGQSLDAVDPTPEVMAKIHRADLVLTSGQGEEWAVSGFDDPRMANSVVRLDLLKSAKLDVGCKQFWLDPDVAKDLANTLAERLVLRRPAQAKLLRGNARKFTLDIDGLLTEFDQRLLSVRGKKVLVLSADYSSFSRAFGLIEVHPINANPLRLNDADIRKLREAIRRESPAAMLAEVGLPPAVQQDLSQKLNLPILTIDSLGSSAGDGRNTYQAILRFDLEQVARLRD